ncbi:alpha/beta fold hydrolase [Arthrobacter sp. 08Y14]|uniref:alpha/beta fold hydrolase n=1 Tax=Arthrobacter sp. 08Y14 TaxID=2058885 RepID=UPI000CE367D7|nr:alpha/beta hydrolase [Arthrobacter sp. 08Y14]
MTADVGEFRSVWTYLNRTPHALRTVEARGVRTRYLEAGDPSNPALILLHGTAGSLENFCANYEALSRDYHVLGLDLLGCGYTDKPDFDYQISDYAAHVRDFMDALGIREASLIGVSLGSWVAARLARDLPERIVSLVALAPAGIVVDAAAEESFAADVRRRRGAAAADPTWETVSAAMGRLMLHREDLIDDLVAVRLGIYRQDSMKAAMGHLLAFTRGNNKLTRAEWSEIRQPMLVVASVDAPNMFLDNAYEITRLVPGAELYEMHGCDHWPQFEQPEQFHEAVLGFLGRHVKGRELSDAR